MEKEVVPSFANIEEVINYQAKKERFEMVDGYPRDGYAALYDMENRISSLIGLNNEWRLELFGCGMLAVTEVIELDFPTKDSVILYGQDLYNQSLYFVNEELHPRGIKTIGVESDSLLDIEQTIKKYRPDVILLETVTNGPSMTVLDVEKFLEISALDYNPLIVLDNSLPISSILPPSEIIEDKARKIIVVESGTKFFSLNRTMAGLAYTKNEYLKRRMMYRRRCRGTLLVPESAKILGKTLPGTKTEFDLRNRLVVSNTSELTRACFEVENEDDVFITTYPNLDSYEKSEFVNSKYPHGCSPVFFLGCLGELNQFELTERLWENPIIRKYCNLGQSFGFDRTRIWPDPHFDVIRIAGGTENKAEIQELSEAFKETLSKIN
ncbi:hypothetical protein A3F00_00825 [Candidatus Daviesbacteria bacterium RIFCSPHIGHO2_12_FULL_37_11]|uniref:Aminotransferase class I/classII domain-containing protein n=1 Tax=Candidatus Daviesbacteria bacterium RIFCSPHIGHO2_12_FULL_37_11 TaxID=1797777 RepID=A0A1F5KDU0_9BACT|nr:MAG: hypothetical protein A2111_02285 [Candidatus Daviesbacteria bacterium GWA1_38_6]OGE16004.1 MAG: hypothetical protein A2769_02980 [Candidatus Daviesbacteria bacterium RIFCSPHIGHO2_01_FULL_37_27]OGE39113.1 MAG: hypothetical protein A3F00_00825 [Candidatus Daviesbacteria bacterium RIFCSPHIGHO2_12_FULL_37_11]OGE45503.1 MAG: hypothetical protein A3B39_04180 [Candidatus Daviesbacteria bacterium RIFCSPLOWO2_01_FULL_37_10]